MYICILILANNVLILGIKTLNRERGERIYEKNFHHQLGMKLAIKMMVRKSLEELHGQETRSKTLKIQWNYHKRERRMQFTRKRGGSSCRKDGTADGAVCDAIGQG